MPADSAVLDQISDYIELCRLRVKSGITAAELTELAVSGMRLAIRLLDVLNLPGEQKKAEVLKLVAYFFDNWSDACVPLVARPLWWLVKPAARVLVMSLASGAVDALVPLVRSAT